MTASPNGFNPATIHPPNTTLAGNRCRPRPLPSIKNKVATGSAKAHDVLNSYIFTDAIEVWDAKSSLPV
jgi:hypothetical protein